MSYCELIIITCDNCDKTVDNFTITRTAETYPYTKRLCTTYSRTELAKESDND